MVEGIEELRRIHRQKRGCKKEKVRSSKRKKGIGENGDQKLQERIDQVKTTTGNREAATEKGSKGHRSGKKEYGKN